jgi:hypothetical protein
MAIVRLRSVQFGLTLAAGLAVSLLAVPAHAYTPEQEQACTPDAFRLCSSEIPDVDRVTACMIRKQSQLSPGCRAFFRPEPDEVVAAPAGRPMAIKPATRKSAKASAKPRKPKKPGKPAAK